MLKWKNGLKGAVVALGDAGAEFHYTCNKPYTSPSSTSKGLISCSDGSGYMFNYNTYTKKFVSAYAFVNLTDSGNGTDTISVAYGTCAKF